MKSIDIIGKKFGRLTVVEFSHSKGYEKYYSCRCDCGKTKTVLKGNLLNGKTKSCGCYQKEMAIKANLLPENRRKLHDIFRHMKSRCYDPKNNRYDRYGGRGIKICDEWLNDVESFCDWALLNGYKDGLTIDRIDVNSDYCPQNCRWVTQQEQSLNTTRNVYISYKGETKTLKEWANELGIKNTTLHNRIKYYGWPIERAFETPTRVR